MTGISFFVRGTPVQEGNITPWGTHAENKRKRGQKRGRLDDWRGAIRSGFIAAGGVLNYSGPVSVVIQFILPEPKHIPANRENRPTVRPDLDKLARAVLDALTGAAYKDDSQVVVLHATKAYGCHPGATIGVNGGVVATKIWM